MTKKRDDDAAASGIKRGRGLAAIAQEIMDRYRLITDPGGTTFLFDGFWGEITDQQLQRYAHIADGPGKSTIARRRETIGHIRSQTVTSKPIEWGRVADYEVPCLNAVVDIRSGKPRPHSPDDMLDKVLPLEHQPGAKCEEWLAALARMFPDNDGEIEAIQESFGYIIMPHARYKKAIVLIGPSNTGKSGLVAKVAAGLVGARNVCTLPLDKMADPVARAVIVGKMLNVLTELNPEHMNADDGFKQFVSTEEPVFINPKYKPPFLYVPTAKHLFAANPPLPRGLYKEEAVLGRLHIIPFKHVLTPDEQDNELVDRILACEMPGVLLWAIQGAARLFAQKGQFSPIAAAEETLAEIGREANPIIQFLAERTEGNATAAIPLVRLADAFNSWQRGSRKVTTKGVGRMLRNAGHVIKDVRTAPLPGQSRRGAPVASLIGFDLITVRIPDRFKVDQDAIISEGDAIEGIEEFHGESPI